MTQASLFSTPDYRVARLTDADRATVQTLLERCADYFDLVEGFPPSDHAAADLFLDVAPGKTLDDKLLLGVWDVSGGLAGVLDVMCDYPTPGEWFIGLMLIDPARRGQGIGEQICRAFATWAAQQGVTVMGLGVVEANAGALRFWQRMGFEIVRRTPPRPFGNRTHVVIMMRGLL
ncbi:MAG: GNAT family N-acetyltransferase [Chloroflexi bacterium]|nr:GNAT family N-acetyltransferase [Chloroflexota bacterium]